MTDAGARQDSEQAANQLLPGGSGGPLVPLAIGIVGVGLALLMIRERAL
ncbi:MAG: hypothetical protein ACN4GZ_01430 [Acidimicrobiales bacterium]